MPLYDTDAMRTRLDEALVDPTDLRYFGTNATYSYLCPRCDVQLVDIPPDYPYPGPNSTATCCHCYQVMRLTSATPVEGTSRFPFVTEIRNSV